MGVSISSHEMEQAARRRSKTIDDSIAEERLRQVRTVRVLMLGLSGAGKSTLAMQVRFIHDPDFIHLSTRYVDLIRQDLALALLGVIADMNSKGHNLGNDELKQLTSKLQHRLKSKNSHVEVVNLRHEVSTLVSQKELWTFIEQHMDVEASLLASYLLRSQERILSDSYTPNDQDLVRARQKKTGLKEVVFHYKGFEFSLCDVDGQCSVKKKLLQNFEESVSAILFAVSLASYVSKSRHHDDKTELHDAMQVFKTVCDYKGFENTPIILILNKADVFEQVLHKVPFTKAFPEFTGKNDVDDATKFIEAKFRSFVEDSPDRLFTQVTNATDTPSTRTVFEASLAVILEKA